MHVDYELWPLLGLFLTAQTLAFLITVTVIVIIMLILSIIAERVCLQPLFCALNERKIGAKKGHRYQLLAHKFLPFAYPVTGGILGSITVCGELCRVIIFFADSVCQSLK